MAELLPKIKAQVANSKREITNFANFINGFVPERDFPILEQRKQDISREFVELEKACLDLEILADDPTLADSRTDYEEKYYASLGKALTFLKSNITNDSSESYTSGSTHSTVREIRQNFGQTSKRSLPRVNLPSFSGYYESWLGFHDLFKSLVDDDKEIPDIEKLYHLKGCLRDEAAEVLASIELCSENYTIAWNLLKERYDNRKTIRQAYVKRPY